METTNTPEIGEIGTEGEIARLQTRLFELEQENLRLKQNTWPFALSVDAGLSLNELAEVIDNFGANIYIKDEAGRYLLLNRRIEQVFGLERATALGQTDYELFPNTPTQLADSWRLNDQQVLTTGITYQWEEQIMHGNDLHTYLSVKFPLRQANGQPYAVCGISTDITEQKRTEHNLQFLARASQLLATSLDSAALLEGLARLLVPDLADWAVLYLVDNNGQVQHRQVLHSDPARAQFGETFLDQFNLDFSPGHPVWQTLETGQSNLIANLSDALFVDRAPNAEVLQALRQQGLRSAICVPLRAGGRVLGALNLLTAGSDRQYGQADLQLAEELAHRIATALDNARLYKDLQNSLAAQQEVDRLKDHFLSLVSHELRTPLTAIKGFAQLVQRHINRRVQNQAVTATPEVERDGKMLGNIIYQVDRMNDLINEMLDVSRIQTRKFELKRQPGVDLAVLLNRVVEQQQGTADFERICLEVIPPIPVGNFDTARLEQVVTNLLGNAFKYSPAGSPVILRLTQQLSSRNPGGQPQPMAICAVQDCGYGVAAEDQARIFELFYRSRTEETRQIDGLGLGLYICRQIIQQHGGQLWLESQLGQGSTFYFSLPL